MRMHEGHDPTRKCNLQMPVTVDTLYGGRGTLEGAGAAQEQFIHTIRPETFHSHTNYQPPVRVFCFHS